MQVFGTHLRAFPEVSESLLSRAKDLRPDSGPMRLIVYDTMGRYEVKWDGMDEPGRPAGI